jgi:hypothetical protein
MSGSRLSRFDFDRTGNFLVPVLSVGTACLWIKATWRWNWLQISMLCSNPKFVGYCLYSLTLPRIKNYSGELCILSTWQTWRTWWRVSCILVPLKQDPKVLPLHYHIQLITAISDTVAHNDVRKYVNLVLEEMRHILWKYMTIFLEKNTVRIKTVYRP